jgi:hypothetical protein
MYSKEGTIEENAGFDAVESITANLYQQFHQLFEAI